MPIIISWFIWTFISKYFRFVIAGKTYQFCVPPFGLSTVPREFTKTLAPVVHLLRTQGIRVHAYLDDWIIWADSPGHSLQHTRQTTQLIQSLRWTVNWKKSMLDPSRILNFLGLHFNLERAIVSPPDPFLDSLTSVLSRLSTSTAMPAYKISSITCRISHLAPFIHYERLHLRFLQFWIKRHWATQSVMGHSDPTGCGISLSTPLVQQTRSSSRRASASLGTQPVFLHRCISNRMGSHLAESSFIGTVVSTRILSVHQLAGDRGHPISSISVGTSVAQSDCSCALRQQYSSGLHSQTGGAHSISLFNKTFIFWTSGEQGDSSLCFTLRGRQSLGVRLPLHILGRLRPSVRLPSSSHSSPNHPEDQGLSRHHGDSHCLAARVSTVTPIATTTHPMASHTADQRSTVPIHFQHPPPSVPQRA